MGLINDFSYRQDNMTEYKVWIYRAQYEYQLPLSCTIERHMRIG